MTVCMYVCMYLCVYVCMCVCVSFWLAGCLSVCPSVRPSVRPSVCLSVCLSVCMNYGWDGPALISRSDTTGSYSSATNMHIASDWFVELLLTTRVMGSWSGLIFFLHCCRVWNQVFRRKPGSKRTNLRDKYDTREKTCAIFIWIKHGSWRKLVDPFFSFSRSN